jgi:hypothetical protein
MKGPKNHEFVAIAQAVLDPNAGREDTAMFAQPGDGLPGKYLVMAWA